MLEEFEIKNIVRFKDGIKIASVNFRLGPVTIYGAKVFSKNNERWLSMPGHIDESGEWGSIVYFIDKAAKDSAEAKILEALDKAQ